MIISRTPYRISFLGGGTDFPKWYNKNEGAVISTSIDKYCYIVTRPLPKIFNYNYRIRYYLREETKTISQIKHPVVRNVLLKYYKKPTIDITHHGDLIARSGIGSSSSFSCGLLKTIFFYNKLNLKKKDLAKATINLEQKVLKETVGSQDQVIAAYGGFNHITFKKNDFNVKKIKHKNSKKLLSNLNLFYFYKLRESSKVEKSKFSNIDQKQHILNDLYSLVDEGLNVLKSSNNFLKEFGDLLDINWDLKKKLSNKVSNDHLDNVIKKFKNLGADGCKLLGAGNGGFILVLADKDKINYIKKKVKFPYIKVNGETEGSKIIFNSKEV